MEKSAWKRPFIVWSMVIIAIVGGLWYGHHQLSLLMASVHKETSDVLMGYESHASISDCLFFISLITFIMLITFFMFDGMYTKKNNHDDCFLPLMLVPICIALFTMSFSAVKVHPSFTTQKQLLEYQQLVHDLNGTSPRSAVRVTYIDNRIAFSHSTVIGPSVVIGGVTVNHNKDSHIGWVHSDIVQFLATKDPSHVMVSMASMASR